MPQIQESSLFYWPTTGYHFLPVHPYRVPLEGKWKALAWPKVPSTVEVPRIQFKQCNRHYQINYKISVLMRSSYSFHIHNNEATKIITIFEIHRAKNDLTIIEGD